MEHRLAARLARAMQPRDPHILSRNSVPRPWRGLRWICPTCEMKTATSATRRSFSASAFRRTPQQPNGRGPFASRLRSALRNTKVQWRPIPVGLGIGFLGLLQMYRVNRREKRRREDEEQEELLREKQSHVEGRPRKRKRVRPDGPWSVQIMAMLPLKTLSRLWGRFNAIEIPYHLRVPGFTLYSWIFGVNLSEVSEPDLHAYPNLASFFYRELKPGVRPLADNPAALLSPADGKILQFGQIERGEVEQVKGMTYSLEALLGSASPTFTGPPDEEDITASADEVDDAAQLSEDSIRADEEFATMSGVSYKLPQTFAQQNDRRRHQTNGRHANGRHANGRRHPPMDASTKSLASSVAEVRADFALADAQKATSWFFPSATSTTKVAARPTALYYAVVYLAPGDYHRFHSPTAWVVERRRHFAGELYSVSPYLQRSLPGLLTLNERVALLGRWRWGFFSCTPVGATNVGSIRVRFDAELRTNSLTTDTAADRAAEAAARRGEPYRGFAEATYHGASAVLGGHALRRGEEMGGFQLGSSIVLVFEAPVGERGSLDEGWAGEKRKGGWRWGISKGQKVKYGEALGWVEGA